jgi:NAD(P)-dependent dehydrogenase (short-subunit alcohol dehydrogenase family)
MPKTWLITGCSRRLGRALSEAVLMAGDNLVATARKTSEIGDLAERAGDRVITLSLDVTDYRAACEAVKAAVSAFGRLDVLANVAGYGNLGSIEDTSIEDFHAQIETNLFGVINLSKAAIPTMRMQRSGHIVNFSSVGGRVGSTGRAPYSAAKFGVEGFSEVMATEMAPLGVKVTIIEPGGFRTDFAGSSKDQNLGRPPRLRLHRGRGRSISENLQWQAARGPCQGGTRRSQGGQDGRTNFHGAELQPQIAPDYFWQRRL